jgi:hypothetical protein
MTFNNFETCSQLLEIQEDSYVDAKHELLIVFCDTE